MLRFKFSYFVITVVLFLLELYIGFFINDQLIRPYIGDFLVVILIYFFLKTFINLPVWTAAIIVLLFSYLVEISQYFKLVNKLGLQDLKLVRIMMGTTFSWTDILAYTTGIAFLLFIELKLVPLLLRHKTPVI